MPEEPTIPKKYWWTVAIVVPLAVAFISVLPKLIPQDRGTDKVAGRAGPIPVKEINQNVNFVGTQIILEEIHGSGGEAPSDTVAEALSQALVLVRAGKFSQAIPLLESVAEGVQSPALLNNIGAAYWATGDQNKAKLYFDRALESDSTQAAAQSNLASLLGSVAIVTPSEGAVTKVPSHLLRFYTGVTVSGLPLRGGATIAFSKIDRFEIVSAPTADDAAVVIKLFDGRTIRDKVPGHGTLRGPSDLGPLKLRIRKTSNVVFQRE